MPSTTVHIPDKLLSRIDEIVKEKGISRNRFIVEACEQAFDNDAGQWPEGFFDEEHNKIDLKLLKEGVKEMEKAILRLRRNRKRTSL
jgi:predicted transcriptional regulator